MEDAFLSSVREGARTAKGAKGRSSALQRIRIATRRSRLALAQASLVADRLRQIQPRLAVELVEVTTRGDIDRSASLAAVGGKGAFIEALEEALRNGRADIAVHSMKDVPATLPEGFALAAFGPRADVRDALVTRTTKAATLGELKPGARVGTASIRRRALVTSLRRDLDIVPLRGNVDTRLRRLDDGRFDALLLASAGLDRLDLSGRVSQRIAADVLVPAPGQGALAVEFLATRRDISDLAGAGVDAKVERCVLAERQLTRRLGADCSMPIGVYCAVERSTLRLVAAAVDAEGKRRLHVELVGDDPIALGNDAATRLDTLGVRDLLERGCASG